MIVVTGTKRSGTSMWMQILQAGGLPTTGEAFSKTWEDTIKDANKRGFYESILRRGIYYATNPHPESGSWLPPNKTRHLGVKVFIPGVVRSDVLYLTRVIASVRPFRQYASSLTRLYTMEKEAQEKLGRSPLHAHMDPILEWWVENFLLIRDITTRRYPVRLVSYESILEDPERLCGEIFRFLEKGDPVAAAAAVHPEDRTQDDAVTAGIEHEFSEVFDEYHDRVKSGGQFDAAFLQKMNDTHLELLPQIQQQLSELAQKRRTHKEERRAQAEREGKPRRSTGALNVDRLDALFHPSRGDY